MDSAEFAPVAPASELPTIDTQVPGFFERLLALRQSRAVLVMADQATASIGNFVTFNLLGRWLPQSHYGAFGITLETMFFFNGLQAALVNYPLTIKGATEGHGRLPKIATASICFTFALLPLLGILMFATSHDVAKEISTWQLAMGVTFAMLFWQLQETLRRGLMADLRFADAIWGDAISYLGQALSILVLHLMGHLTITTAFLGIGLTSAAAIVVQAIQIGVARVQLAELKSLAIEFWVLGRWMLMANLTVLIGSLGYVWTTKWFKGLDEVAIFIAMVAMMKLTHPVISGISGLITPAVARTAKQAGARATERVAAKYICFGAVLLLPYYLILFLAPALSFRLAYGAHSPYIAYAWLLRLYTIPYFLNYISAVIAAWLTGLGESRKNFFAQAANAAVTLVIGLPLTAWLGVRGIILGGGLSVLASTIINIRQIFRAIRTPPQSL